MNNQSAFPHVGFDEHGSSFICEGMTLRDYFAAAAMQSLARYHEFTQGKISELSFKLADAMLKARGE